MSHSKFMKVLPYHILPPRVATLLRRYENMIAYLIIGGGALVVDVGIYSWLVLSQVDANDANTVSVMLSVLFSFTLNAWANFKTTDSIMRRFASFAFISFIGYMVSSMMIYYFVHYTSIHPILAKGITLPIILAIQYTFNKRFTFKQDTPSTHTAVRKG